MAIKQAAMTCAQALIDSCSMMESTITADQYNRIHGMTHRELAAIMGGPGDNSVNEVVEEYSEYLAGPESMGKIYGWGIHNECFSVVGFKKDSDDDDWNNGVDMKGQDSEGCL